MPEQAKWSDPLGDWPLSFQKGPCSVAWSSLVLVAEVPHVWLPWLHRNSPLLLPARPVLLMSLPHPLILFQVNSSMVCPPHGKTLSWITPLMVSIEVKGKKGKTVTSPFKNNFFSMNLYSLPFPHARRLLRSAVKFFPNSLYRNVNTISGLVWADQVSRLSGFMKTVIQCVELGGVVSGPKIMVFLNDNIC